MARPDDRPQSFLGMPRTVPASYEGRRGRERPPRRRDTKWRRRGRLTRYIAPVGFAAGSAFGLVGRHWIAERRTIRVGLTTQAIASVAGLVAGVMLASAAGVLERFPAFLLLLVPIVGVRGSVFGAMGARISTAIQVGTFEFSWDRDGVLRQNVTVAFVLATATSTALAFAGWGVTLLIGGSGETLFDFAVVAILGGLLASFVIGAVAVGVAWFSVRYELDSDQVTAPVITLTGDLTGVPALVLAAFLVGHGAATVVLGALLLVFGAVTFGMAFRVLTGRAKRTFLESLPVLAVVGAIDLAAGLVVSENETLTAYDVFLVLLPAFLATAGGLGSVFASRLTTKLHLGSVDARLWPEQAVFLDMTVVYLFGFIVFPLLAVAASIIVVLQGGTSPGTLTTVRVLLVSGTLATTLALFVGYYAALVTRRFGLDPDNYSIPTVTSTMDLLGGLCLTVALIGV